MITLNFWVPETADEINKRFNHTGTSIDAKALMVFTLPGHDLVFQSPKSKAIQYAEGAGLGQSQECSQCRRGRFSHLPKITNHPVFIAQ